MAWYHFAGLFILLAIFATLACVMLIPRFKGARTYLFHGIAVAVGFGGPLLADMTAYFQALDWTQYVDKSVLPWIVLGLGVSAIILRRFTNTPPDASKLVGK